jgi:hypothetical protein
MLTKRSEEAQLQSEDTRDNGVFAVLFAIAVLLLWAPPLRSSFWLDETGTFWVIKDGISNLVDRSMNWSSQSPLYYLTAWVALAAGGKHEWILRLPSLAAALAAAWFLYRLAARLFDGTTARLAVLVFACSEPVVFAAADARPYALALCMLVASALALVNWLDTGRWRFAGAYVVLTTLTIYAHYLFGPALVVVAWYALLRAGRERVIGIPKLLSAWAVTGILTLPLVFQLRGFLAGSRAHDFAGAPTRGDFFAGLAPPLVVGPLLLAFLAVWLIAPLRNRERAAPKLSLLLAIFWTLTPPLLLFAIATLSSAKLFVPRYYVSYVPGLCLLAAGLVRCLVPDAAHRMVATAFVGISVVGLASWRHRPYEDWSGASREVSRLSAGKVPVLVASGFVEATDSKTLDDPTLRIAFFAPQEMYPISAPMIRLPYVLNDESSQYMERVVPQIETESRFFLLVRSQGSEGLTFEPWLRGRLATQGFRSHRLGNFGGVAVFLFSQQ